MPLSPAIRRQVPSLLAAAFVVTFALTLALRPRADPPTLSQDWYQYYYPTATHVRRSMQDGGRGLFWNALHNCGQPFLGTSTTGLLAPANVFLLFLDTNRALAAMIAFFLIVAGLSAYAFGRTLDLPPTAALATAVTFLLSNGTIDAVLWGPNMAGPWVGLPAALAFTELILQAPSTSRAIGLGLSLAFSLAPGFPQLTIFGCQVIALRVLWELLLRPRPTLRALPGIAAGALLPLLLLAVVLLPGFQTTLSSVRGSGLQSADLMYAGAMSWRQFADGIGAHSLYLNPVFALPAVVAGAGFFAVAARRQFFFYLATGMLFIALAFGTATPLFDLYRSLPLGSTFRDPYRFVFVANLCMAALVGIGASALLPVNPPSAPLRHLLASTCAVLGVVAALHWGIGLRFTPLEWTLIGAVLACAIVGALAPRLAPSLRLAVAAAVAIQLCALQADRILRLPDTDDFLFSHAAELQQLEKHMTPQDRVLIAGNVFRRGDPFSGYRLNQKTASLFNLPSVHDYESQPGRRYTELFIRARSGRPMQTLNDLYYPRAWLEPSFSRSLLDLTTARYLVVQSEADNTAQLFHPPLPVLLRGGGISVYENTSASPRAFYVPRLEVVSDPASLLERLADPALDARTVALVEEPPASGFLGEQNPPGRAIVDFLRNNPEHLELRVDAPARGFLVLADEYAAGWEAEVDGRPAPILRANYAFRAVEVPAGVSTVTFRYLPISVALGAAISATTGLALAAWALRLIWRTVWPA